MPKQDNVHQAAGASSNATAEMNRPTQFEGGTTNNEFPDNANESSYKDPPHSNNQGFNLGERPKSNYEKAALKNKRK